MICKGGIPELHSCHGVVHRRSIFTQISAEMTALEDPFLFISDVKGSSLPFSRHLIVLEEAVEEYGRMGRMLKVQPLKMQTLNKPCFKLLTDLEGWSLRNGSR
jgi:hypothetical protein